jgi:hypothetical protein
MHAGSPFTRSRCCCSRAEQPHRTIAARKRHGSVVLSGRALDTPCITSYMVLVTSADQIVLQVEKISHRLWCADHDFTNALEHTTLCAAVQAIRGADKARGLRGLRLVRMTAVFEEGLEPSTTRCLIVLSWGPSFP